MLANFTVLKSHSLGNLIIGQECFPSPHTLSTCPYNLPALLLYTNSCLTFDKKLQGCYFGQVRQIKTEHMLWMWETWMQSQTPHDPLSNTRSDVP